MKPYKILLFLISIFLVLSLLSFVFPKNGIFIGNNWIIHFPDIKSIITPDESKYADISEILEYHQSDITDNIEDLLQDTILELNDSIHVIPDSLKAEIKPDTTSIADSIKLTKKSIQPGKIRQYLE